MEDHGQQSIHRDFHLMAGNVISGDFVFTYSPRDAATAIAGPSMTEALFKLMYATGHGPRCKTSAPPNRPAPARPGGSHFVIVGHSFEVACWNAPWRSLSWHDGGKGRARMAACGKARIQSARGPHRFINPRGTIPGRQKHH